MLSPVTQAPFTLKPPHLLQPTTHMAVMTAAPQPARPRRRRRPRLLFSRAHFRTPKPNSFLTRVTSDDDDAAIYTSTEKTVNSSDVALFVAMLGLDQDPRDRELAIETLWKYSLGGKEYIDMIMKFPGCINLTLNLLRSESSSASEAAAGLLRSIALFDSYRDLVAQSGAIEEIIGLLTRASTTSEVKEQAICTLLNLSVDEKFRGKIANSDVLPLLVKFVDDEDTLVQEASAGILANLASSEFNHSILVEAGVIPQLAKLLKPGVKGSKVKKEARNALLELCKDRYNRITILEEGLVLVPLIGSAAYESFRPNLDSQLSFPDGTPIKIKASKTRSMFGASEVLLGLQRGSKDDPFADVEEAKMIAMNGKARQEYLAGLGAIELDDSGMKPSEVAVGLTLLPWMDGVARLVLILGLEDESAIARAAESIADASINEHMRIAFKEAGAVKPLVQLLDCRNDAVRLAATQALERLSVSNGVCQFIEVQGALDPLINNLKNREISEILMEKTLDILGRILDPSKEMKSKFDDAPVPVNGSKASDAHISISKTKIRENVLDSGVITRLLEILKTSTPRLQRKAASILEFCTVIDPSMGTIISVDIESGLDAVFRQKVLEDVDSETDDQLPEKRILEIEEAGLVISTASRLLTKLLDSEKFCQKINSANFTKLLCNILESDIPLHNKDWVAACLVKLSSLSGPRLDVEDPINMEVTLHETIPRLLEQLKTSFSPQSKEAAVVELNRIISQGVVDSTRAVAAQGGIFPLVKLIEEGSDRAVEASLAILYNLSMDIENHPVIIAAGALPVLRRIVITQRSHWTRALHILRTLPTLSGSV